MSTREHEQYPDNIVMDSPIGQAKLAITDANHVSMCADVVTIRGKQVRAHLHVNDYGCGNGFEPSRDSSNPNNSYHALYATKVGTMGEYATDAQRKAIIAAWVPAINKFMAEHPELRKAAFAADQNNAAMGIENEIAELEQKIVAKRAELAKVLASGRNNAGVIQFPCCKAYGVPNKNHVCDPRPQFADEFITEAK
jgi:hypothetical protein